jgi:hypothetical protein
VVVAVGGIVVEDVEDAAEIVVHAAAEIAAIANQGPKIKQAQRSAAPFLHSYPALLTLSVRHRKILRRFPAALRRFRLCIQ